jgi:hypothetical protein
VQVPASPPTPRNPVVTLRQLEQPQNVVDLWFQLFYDILGNDQLTEIFHNVLYLVLGNEEPTEARIRINLLIRVLRECREGKYELQNNLD